MSEHRKHSPSFEIDMAEVKVEDEKRQRKELTGIEELAASISRLGLLNPIILDRENKLIAGRRRLEACRQLGLGNIAARRYESLDPTEQCLVELDENLRRVDLPWQETAAAIAELHKLKTGTAEGSWTQEATAEYCGFSPTYISLCLLVTKGLSEEKVRNCNSLVQAGELLRRRRQLAFDTAMSKETFDESGFESGLEEGFGEGLDLRVEEIKPGDEVPAGLFAPAEPSLSSKQVLRFAIQQGDFFDFAKSYSGPKFNLIHCDFPYGINYDQSNAAANRAHDTEYKDSEELFWNLTRTLLSNQERLVLSSAHMIFWFSMKYYEKLKEELEKNSWFVVPHPLIWGKSDNAGIVSDYRRRPRHTYETAFLCSRGDRPLAGVKADFVSAPTAKNKEGHISAKPLEVLHHFYSMICTEDSDILDPTCGSGTSIRAGIDLKANRGLGLELNPDTALSAGFKLTSHQEGIADEVPSGTDS